MQATTWMNFFFTELPSVKRRPCCLGLNVLSIYQTPAFSAPCLPLHLPNRVCYTNSWFAKYQRILPRHHKGMWVQFYANEDKTQVSIMMTTVIRCKFVQAEDHCNSWSINWYRVAEINHTFPSYIYGISTSLSFVALRIYYTISSYTTTTAQENIRHNFAK